MTEQEFFTVHYGLTANIELLDSAFMLPSKSIFEAEIPAPFIVASEFSQLDALTESARLELKSSDFKHVVQLLDTQNSKLNLLLTFMLSQQDEPHSRFITSTFGASRFSFRYPSALEIGTQARSKLFLDHPAAAIYCYSSVIDCQADDQHYLITMKYDLLRDTDQDLLIKAALYQQQKLLRQRSLDRNKP
ncbi:PilZ domain-containing protein [Vibrio qinghaiensis]|uniref:PilZ domain-containing protein n=1 Tax=Vibrio qinghaiensis TaxID=2025808 RepID=A0A223MWI3_9VIBR|nr:PilZ domain-containing protein [Vibrio qinghaiensis]ASU21939.1 PilZ domain-containing protein [Vibrio qinghaiensis]